MTDLYLKAADEAAMNAVLIDAGLAYLEDETLCPAEGVDIDVIGQIWRVVGYAEDGEPVIQAFNEWHVNVRAQVLTEDQAAIVAPISIIAPDVPFRVWA